MQLLIKFLKKLLFCGRGPQIASRLSTWVAKILNVGLHNYFDVKTFFASVFFSYSLNFLVLKLFDFTV